MARASVHTPAQPTPSRHGPGQAAAAVAITRAASRHTVARASVEAGAARVEQARSRPSGRRRRRRTRRLAPHRGARQRRSQRGPLRASTVTATQQPPPSSHAPPRATPWRAPEYKPAQPTSSKHGHGQAAAAVVITRAASRHTVARASVEASAARVERARWRPQSRRPRPPTRRLAPNRGARQRSSQRSPRRASTMATSEPPPSAAHAPPRATPRRTPAHEPVQPASREHDCGLIQPQSQAAHPHKQAVAGYLPIIPSPSGVGAPRRRTGRVGARSREGHRPCTLLPDSSCVERVLGSECVTAVVHTVDPVHLSCYPGCTELLRRNSRSNGSSNSLHRGVRGTKPSVPREVGESGRESLHTRCYWTSTT